MALGSVERVLVLGIVVVIVAILGIAVWGATGNDTGVPAIAADGGASPGAPVVGAPRGVTVKPPAAGGTLPLPGAQPLAHRQQILRRLLHDRVEPGLLLLGGIDLDVEMLQHAIEVLVKVGGIDRTAAVPPAALREGLGADGSSEAADQRREREASEPVHDCSLGLTTSREHRPPP